MLLLAVVVLSLVLGARPLPLAEIWPGLTDPDAEAYRVVRQMRVPRTALGVLAGVALGLAGAMMQSLTRNPLADPGLLGINAGAAAAVVSAITFFGITSLLGYVWFAFAGAAAVAAAVWTIGGGRVANPARLVLAGMAVNVALIAYVNAVQLLDTASLERMRFWTVGSLAAPPPGTALRLAPFILVGVVLVALLAQPLNLLAMGDETARALGGRPGLTRAVTVVAVTLLCGAATAGCGPIAFVGLIVPHLVRRFTGPDLRWLLPTCALVAPALLLGADVLGRVLGRPGELQVGIVTAVLGGAFLVFVVRGGRRLWL
ncbi:iron chelate uptake ABC transporter family permease subunit [Natronosporangium hydrolyticum]|uniref:Iron chelate uptake ABC transporter family permease subunit n=1 Tax=Natronosporangium hydrolyticum TaxID=2811111 RepID=A0A895YNC7_9ACTN|nr:iron chelate uptake ABC transporter family permease subunit [Natronosporangium hydrolyticum]QSB17462.1 iron chelate uptake ABC transporter family permease subunit [Natronosporangium hydrolyticum]